MNIDAGTVIALAGALGVGTILASIVASVLNRKKNTADTSGVLVQTSEKLVGMLSTQAQVEADRAREWRQRFEETDTKLRATSTKLDQIQDELEDQHVRLKRLDQLVTAETEWAQRNGHTDAPVLKLMRS